MCTEGKTTTPNYLEFWVGAGFPEIALLVCSAALYLDDELAEKLIEQAVTEHDRPRVKGMIHHLKNTGYTWVHPDKWWHILGEVRLPCLKLLRERISAEDLIRVYQTLANHAEGKAAAQVALGETGQYAAYKLRRARCEAAFYRLHIPQEEEAGAQAMRDLYGSSPPNAQEAIKKAIASLLESGELDPKWADILEQE